MHSTILTSRRAAALKQLTDAATAIVKQLELDPSLLTGFTPQVKDQQVKDLLILESAAGIMHALARLSGSIDEEIPEPDVTTVTEPDEATASAPITPEDLPEPVIDEQPAVVSEEASAEESSQELAVVTERASAEDLFGEPTVADITSAEPVIEEEPEAPAPKPTRKSKRRGK